MTHLIQMCHILSNCLNIYEAKTSPEIHVAPQIFSREYERNQIWQKILILLKKYHIYQLSNAHVHHLNAKDTKYAILLEKCANQNTKYAN